MRTLTVLIFALLAFTAAPVRAASSGETEYIILTGGVSLYAWEKFKGPAAHDHWWANFVRASRIRMEQIRAENPNAKITWLVYKESYLKRGKQEGRDLLPLIDSVREAMNAKLIYFNKTQEVIDYLNHGQPRDRVKIADFEYFGHSNRACWMFDYSAEMDSASKCWLHVNDFSKINRGIFARDVFVKSWGCHSGEEMTGKWRAATGTKMWGAIGKTQYMTDELPVLAETRGRWVN
jgi:hypothetical protein